MRILLLTPSLPDRLSRVRAYHLLQCLSYRHEVVLLSLIASRNRLHKLEHLTGACQRVETVHHARWKSLINCLVGFPGRQPFRVLWCKSASFRGRLRELLRRERFDVVFAKRGRMAPYLSEAGNIPTVLDLTDSMAMFYERARLHGSLAQRALGSVEWRRQRVYEAGLWRQATTCLVCSPVDAEHLGRLSGFAWPNLHVVPNVVDCSYFAPALPALSEPGRILLSGDMGALANQDAVAYFCRQIWPRIHQKCPGARTVIAGPRPPRCVTQFSTWPGVEVKGFVPDLRKEMVRAQVVVCPVRIGAGTRNKILQAMAINRPVVSTRTGAEGLAIEHGKHLFIADTPDKFAACVTYLMSDPDEAAKMADCGQVLVKERYSLEAMAELMERLLVSCRGRTPETVLL